MTYPKIFAKVNSASSKVHHKSEFLLLAEQVKRSGQSLWSEFTPDRLLTFDQRWGCLVKRDPDHESLVHTKGDAESIFPWV
jgi:hypothetical protein